jgi:hypothetical protein
MTRPFVLAAVAASVIGLGYATFHVAIPWRRTLAFKRFEHSTRRSLAGLATISIPPSFEGIGRGSYPGTRNQPDFDPATLDKHRNDRIIVFRFEQAQHRNMGAHFQDPVLLNVTLYNRKLPAPDASTVSHTLVEQFYGPIQEDEPRRKAHLEAQRWLAPVTNGAAITHAAATNEGRGDNLLSGPPERWLVIHIDPERRIRVDMFVWRKAYSLDAARALVQRIAESLEVSPKLQAMFDDVKNVGEREATRHAQTVANGVARLAACGIATIAPGDTVVKDGCAAWLSENRRYMHVARSLGRVQLSAASAVPGEPPKFAAAPLPGRPAALIGPPDFTTAMLYWDESAGKWSIAGLQERLDDDELRGSPLLDVITRRITDRSSAYLLSMARYDFQFHGDRVAIDDFFSESERVAAALRAGTLIPGVVARPDAFGK